MERGDRPARINLQMEHLAPLWVQPGSACYLRSKKIMTGDFTKAVFFAQPGFMVFDRCVGILVWWPVDSCAAMRQFPAKLVIDGIDRHQVDISVEGK